MTLKNRKNHSMEVVLTSLQDGFNQFLNSNGNMKTYNYAKDEEGRLLLSEKGEVEIYMIKVGVSQIEVITLNDSGLDMVNYLERFLERLYITGNLYNSF